MNKVTIDRALIERLLGEMLSIKPLADCDDNDEFQHHHETLDLLREAMAEPAVEPFGYVSEHNCAEPYKFQFHTRFTGIYPDNCVSVTPVFTSPPPPAEPAPVPLLSDEEIIDAGLSIGWVVRYMDKSESEFARAIEQLVRRKAGL